MNWRPAPAHLFEDLLRRNSPIHYPDSFGLAIELLDLLQKPPQGLSVLAIASKHFVGQRVSLGRDHQGNDHLQTVRPLISAMPVALLATRIRISLVEIRGRITFEVGAGQIVKQDFESSREKVAPALLEMPEELSAMFEQPVVAMIQGGTCFYVSTADVAHSHVVVVPFEGNNILSQIPSSFKFLGGSPLQIDWFHPRSISVAIAGEGIPDVRRKRTHVAWEARPA